MPARRTGWTRIVGNAVGGGEVGGHDAVGPAPLGCDDQSADRSAGDGVQVGRERVDCLVGVQDRARVAFSRVRLQIRKQRPERASQSAARAPRNAGRPIYRSHQTAIKAQPHPALPGHLRTYGSGLSRAGTASVVSRLSKSRRRSSGRMRRQPSALTAGSAPSRSARRAWLGWRPPGP